MPSTVAFTIALGGEANAAAALTRKTFLANHPGIPFFIISGPFYSFFALRPGAGHGGEITALRAMIGSFLSFSFERVIYLDADVLVLAPLPWLVESTDPVTLTNDVATCDYGGMPAPRANAGVIAASDRSFWRLWMLCIYSFFLPITGAFFDQFILRLMLARREIPFVLLPERENKDYYNITYHEHPGEWSVDGEILRKGDARVRLWHWAGYARKTAFEFLPQPVRVMTARQLKRPETGSREQDEHLLRSLLVQYGEPFLDSIAREIGEIQTNCLEGITIEGRATLEGVYGTDTPAGWDQLRALPPGFHRRFLPNAPRFVYSRDEARLRAPDVDALDVRGIF